MKMHRLISFAKRRVGTGSQTAALRGGFKIPMTPVLKYSEAPDRATQIAAGFTLIEVMLSVLILALLATAAAMSLAQPLRAARSHDLLRQLRSIDSSARAAAVASGQDVRMVFDLSDNSIARLDGPQLLALRSRENLPIGYQIDQIRVSAQSTFSGAVPIDVSPMGFSRSYALHILGPSFDRWIIFAGMSGDMTQAPDDAATDAILATTASTM